MPVTIATIIAVSTDAMIFFHSKADISPFAPLRKSLASKPDSTRWLNPIITLPANGRTGHVVAPRPHQHPTVTRTAPQNPIVMIPARTASTRLPGKPLALIAGVPMIVHVWRRAVAAALGPVVVACGHNQIADAVET